MLHREATPTLPAGLVAVLLLADWPAEHDGRLQIRSDTFGRFDICSSSRHLKFFLFGCRHKVSPFLNFPDFRSPYTNTLSFFEQGLKCVQILSL